MQAWEKARTLLEAKLENLPPYAVNKEYGPFLYSSVYWAVFSFDKGDRHNSVTFSILGDRRDISFLNDICVSTPNIGWSYVNRTRVQHVIEQLPTGYPRFEFEWGRDGHLTSVIVQLGADTLASYDMQPYQWRFEGNRRLLHRFKIPEDILGLTQILNQPIDWEIDVEAEAEKIVKGSELEEFLSYV